MQEVETLKAIYEEKQAKYQALCDAVAVAYEAHESVRRLCEKAMIEMHEAGEELLKAMKA